MAKAPVTHKVDEKPAVPETVQVAIVETKAPEVKLSAQTLAEQAAGREALSKQAK